MFKSVTSSNKFCIDITKNQVYPSNENNARIKVITVKKLTACHPLNPSYYIKIKCCLTIFVKLSILSCLLKNN